MNDDKNDKEHHDTAFIDSTVQEKNVTYFHTDAKLHKKIVGKVLKMAKALNLPIPQSYTFVLKKIYRDQRFRNHPKNCKKALKADKRLRTIAGCLVRELKRNLGSNRGYRGKKEINGTQILIPDTPKAKDSYNQRKKKHRIFCKRAGIEPTIGHF